MLAGARGSSGPLGGEAERQQPLLDVRPVKVIADVAIEPCNHVDGRARRGYQGKPTVHDDARHRLADGWKIRQSGEAFLRCHREAAHLAGDGLTALYEFALRDRDRILLSGRASVVLDAGRRLRL